MATPPTTIKAIFFDFMGTCLDWHTGVVQTLPKYLPSEDRSKFALQWRQDYFDYNAARLAENLSPEDFDITLRKTLDALLDKHPYTAWKDMFDDELKERCVRIWHNMPAWPDVLPALQSLKSQGYELFVSANGATRLQLDLCRSSGLAPVFSMLFSSELLGVYKPAKENYLRTLELVGRRPEECVHVAAHAWDNRGAKEMGMKTVYVIRRTDDLREDMGVVMEESDAFLEDMSGLVEVIQNF
ncbi:hypothetical protein H2200_002677 [Cladophialophora chaetospira]|uniref:Haloacid dehalogenase, type II n=1 Tax=Cladophialophora chaetospira TaxID=386627 RepID=A0AA39CNT0_9EURO|nr:hypothetical protein H2200_002677 [Cladophialophora chaetospira]